MFDKKLAYRIKNLLSHNNNYPLQIKDIAKSLKTRKHKHTDLLDTLFALTKENQILLKNKKYSIPSAPQKLVEGIFDARSLAKNKSFAFVICDDFDVYVSAEDTLTAFHNDKVQISVKYVKRNKKYGIVQKVIERHQKIIVGTTNEYHGNYFLVPDNARIHSNFNIITSAPLKSGKKAVLEVADWGNREMQKLPSGKITEILGNAGNPEVEILSVIKQYNLPLTFPENVLNNLDYIPTEIFETEINRRKDFRDLLTFTIDPASAKDFDDAISLEKNKNGSRLYVHIADVAQYVKVNSPLFAEAVNRGNSYYFPKKVIPMLPEKISNKICSLRPFEEKLTLSVVTDFDNKLNIVSQNVYESIICSNARFNYEEIDDLFDDQTKNIDKQIAETLTEMRQLSSHLSQKRRQNGYLHFDLPETNFIFDDEGHIINLKRSKETESHTLIENFMLIANEFVAKKLSSQNTIFRVHEKPDRADFIKIGEVMKTYELSFEMLDNLNKSYQKLLNSLPNTNFHRVFDKMVLRSLKKAKYEIKNLGHFGLATKNYTHFTSPIRRLSDLIIHHQLKNILQKKQTLFSKIELYDLAKIASEKEIIADNAERDVDFKNKMNFMRKKLGEEYEGVITFIKSSFFVVEIDAYPVTGTVRLDSIRDDKFTFYEKQARLIGRKNGRVIKLTDKVKVQVVKVTDDVIFKLVE